MTIKLGEMLVAAGKITPAELDEALKCQVIFGGRLGTNLIELGCIEEYELAHFLSKKLGVPCVSAQEIMTIPAEIISLVSREIAEKFKIVPLRLEKKRLTIVMAEPSDLAAVDSIAFMTGCIIIPRVAPELRLILALEKYYDIKREIRYIRVSRELTQSTRNRRPAGTTVLGAQTGGSQTEGSSSSPQQQATTQVIVPPPVTEEEMFDLIPITEEFEGFHKMSELPGEPIPSTEPSTPTPPEPIRLPPSSLDELSTNLAEAADRDEIADLVVTFLGHEFTRGAFFLVKGNAATGWRAVTNKRKVTDFDALQVPFTEPSVLKLAAEGKSFYLGSIPETPLNRTIVNAMGGGLPQTALLVPLIMMGRVVALLYADGEQELIREKLPDLQKVVANTTMAFEILILKNKIIST